jgi:two-component system LytT family response regulator
MGTPLVVTTGRGTMVLHPHEIDWIESADNYARLWLGGRSYLLRESMQSLERRMAPHGFVRVHRGAIVRLGAVRQVIVATDGELLAVLSSGVRVPVSRRRRAAFTRAVRAKPR